MRRGATSIRRDTTFCEVIPIFLSTKKRKHDGAKETGFANGEGFVGIEFGDEPAENERRARELFSRFDHEASGTVDADDVRQALCAIGCARNGAGGRASQGALYAPPQR